MDRNNKFNFGVISDTQERRGLSEITEALKPLRNFEDSEKDLDFIIHLGDLSESGIISKYVREAKKLEAAYDREKDNGYLSPESQEYLEVTQSIEYKNFSDNLMKTGVEQSIVIYALWLAQKRGELPNALQNMESLIKNVITGMSDFKTEVRHIMGNADRAFPQKLEATQELLEKNAIISYDKPQSLSLDDKNSLIFWPSFNIDEKNKESLEDIEKTIENFVELNKDKESILIFAHEMPIKGPKRPGVYEDRVKSANLSGSERVPRKQYLPVSKYLLELCRRFPANVKISVACGHMHVPRETLAAGTNFLDFDSSGKAKLRLFGGKKIDQKKYEIAPGKKRTIDLYYLPEGEVGVFEIKEDGEVVYKKLSQ